MTPHPPSRLALAAAFLTVYVIWGSTYLAIRFGVETIPPFLMAAFRYLVPGAILVAWRRARGVPAGTPVQWRSAAIVGTLLLLGGNGLVTWAEQWVPSGLAALLVASVPIWMGLMSWAIEPAARPGARGIAGLLLGFLGVGILVDPRGELGGEAQLFAGAVGIVAASAMWAAGSLTARRVNLPKDPLLSTGMQMLTGGAALLLAGTLAGEWGRLDPGAVSAKSALSLLYLTVFGSLVAFSAYAWLLRATTPAKVSTYAYVNPVVAVVLGWAFAGEPLTARTLVSAAIIVGSVVMITTDGLRRVRPVQPPATSSLARSHSA
jgi:drug/metabolite transporter (DMT)-like permease